uniref:Tumor necrosis factor ligand superfamily member 6-like n=1 Tax=Sinocyclocheilus anshuiensis TaxID=1608454 RepID=A0A671NES6_9TELE
MSGNFGHSPQPVFMVDSGRGHPKQHRYYHQQMPRSPVPCWTFPPARAEMKKRGCGRMNGTIVWGLTLILLLVFAALGLGAYQILRLQTEMQRLTQEIPAQMQSLTPQKQVGLNPAEHAEQNSRSAGTLKWEANLGDAFTEGIKYINGGLQVNMTGLYFVYSRVEFLSPKCNPRDSYTHIMSRQRNGRNRTIMEDHQEGFCTAGSKQPWMTGSHLGSLQHLKQSDWLFVNVSHPLLISKNYHSNYFGLFKIN